MNIHSITQSGGKLLPTRIFEGLNKDNLGFERIKIGGQEYIDFKERELSVLKRITSRGTKIPEIFLYIEFTFTKPHTERLLRELGRYIGKSVELMYIDGYINRGVLQFIGLKVGFDDITKFGNQIVIEGLSNRDYISYDRIMKEGIYIRIIDGLDSNGLKESVSGKVSDVFKINLH